MLFRSGKCQLGFFFIRFRSGKNLGVGVFLGEVLGALGGGDGPGFGQSKETAIAEVKADAYEDKNPSQFVYDPDFNKPGVDDGHIVSNAGRISWQLSSKDKISLYHDEQKKYRNHWGIASTIPPDAAGVQVTPTSRVNVSQIGRAHV